MMNLRPQVSLLHLNRSRLVQRLPDAAGSVVWLEAPYGYGKSVLAAQWARHLEEQGWRVLWISPAGLDLRSALARALDYPPDVPWVLLLDALWHTPTLLVLEDLDGSEQLSAVLKNPHGLILLASRRRLPEPELPKLSAEGRLVHLTASDLAFTLPEAAQLFGDPALAREQWEWAQGWPLPLQLAALTGAAPGGRPGAGVLDEQAEALLSGMRASLEPAAWEEILLLSSVNVLPQEAMMPATEDVIRAGFAQSLQGGHRLHPLTAELLLGHHRAEVQRVVLQQAGRLPLLLRGEAYEHAGLNEALAELLESDLELGDAHPQAVLRWDAVATGERGMVRLCNYANALGAQRREREAAEMLMAAAVRPGDTPEQKLAAYRDALWWLLNLPDLDAARRIVELAEPLLGQVEAVNAVRFLNNAGRVHFESGDYALGEAALQAAISRLEVGHPRRLPPMMNLAMFRYYLYGDLKGRMTLYEEVLSDPQSAVLLGSSRATAHFDLGRQSLLLGHHGQAARHFQQTVLHSRSTPPYRLAAEGFLLLLGGDHDALPGVLAQLQRWERFDLEHQVRGVAALYLVNQGRAAEALKLALAASSAAPGDEASRPVLLAALALALHSLGRTAEADTVLAHVPGTQREARLYWHAARYRIRQDAADLDALLAQTLSGARLLPALVPLGDLPRSRPDLSDAYPLDQVLRSGWKAAVQRRLSEVPPLELRVLGGFEVRVLGAPVTLTQRPRELLTLLLLGYTREEAADLMWPAQDAPSVRNNLNFTLSSLRKMIEPWGQPTYLLSGGLSRVHSDLADLQVALASGDGQSLLALYSGDLSPLIDLPAVDARRTELRGEVARVLFRAATSSPQQAQTYLDRAMRLDV